MRARREISACGLFPLLLMLVFAVFAVLSVLLGARLYRDVTEDGDESFALRASLSYVRGKLRSHDADGAVSVAEYDGTRVLRLTERGDGCETVTYIYFAQGSLCELCADVSMDFDPLAGTAVAELSDFSFELGDRCVRLTAVARSGAVREAVVCFVSDALGDYA